MRSQTRGLASLAAIMVFALTSSAFWRTAPEAPPKPADNPRAAISARVSAADAAVSQIADADLAPLVARAMTLYREEQIWASFIVSTFEQGLLESNASKQRWLPLLRDVNFYQDSVSIMGTFAPGMRAADEVDLPESQRARIFVSHALAVAPVAKQARLALVDRIMREIYGTSADHARLQVLQQEARAAVFDAVLTAPPSPGP